MARPVARLLIADPDRLQLQLLDMLLASGNYELDMVDTGREALEHLKGNTPDLAILALDLPDVEGDVICGKIRRVTRLARTPVILVSPQDGRLGLSDGIRSRARRAGADLVLPRPLGDKNLSERVRALLDARDATPTREGHTTRILDDALNELTPEGAPTGPGEPELDPSAAAAAAHDDASAPAGEDGATASEAVPTGPDEGYAALQRELAALRGENAQLRRKLAEKIEQARNGPNAELQERITELERRNRELSQELEKRDRRDGGGGWFGRRG